MRLVGLLTWSCNDFTPNNIYMIFLFAQLTCTANECLWHACSNHRDSDMRAVVIVTLTCMQYSSQLWHACCSHRDFDMHAVVIVTLTCVQYSSRLWHACSSHRDSDMRAVVIATQSACSSHHNMYKTHSHFLSVNV